MVTVAWEVLSTARNLGTIISDIGKYITFLIPATDPRVQKLLERLHHHIDAVAQPINYCLLISCQKGSCVTNVSFQARELLVKIQKYVFDCIEYQKKEQNLIDTDNMINVLNQYIKDLDFIISSLNLAITVAIASSTNSQLPLSPSSILRATHTISSLKGVGGDLSCSYGSLFQKKDGQWDKIYNECMLKISFNSIRGTYEISVFPFNISPEITTNYIFILSLSLSLSLQTLQQIDINYKSENTIDNIALLWVERIANQIQNQFAFVFHDVLPETTLNTLRPLDLLYLARLCIYENDHYDKNNPKKSFPSHLLASDEELFAVLSDSPQEIINNLPSPISFKINQNHFI